MQRRLTQYPDPRQRGDPIQRQRCDEPPVLQQPQRGKACWQACGSLLEEQLADRDAEDAEQGVEAESRGHAWEVSGAGGKLGILGERADFRVASR